jgi:Fe-S-cluster-containing hydrogenase component 2
MQNLICPQYCPSPFCEVACPTGAITVAVKEKNVYCDSDKCNRCGICRVMCMTFSRDDVLARRRPWVSSDWVRTRAG